MERRASLRRSLPLRARSKTPPSHRETLPGPAYTTLKAAIAARADYRCENPQCRTAVGPFDLHHVTKRSQGGADTPANCVYLCRRPETATGCHERTDWIFRKGRLLITPILGAPGTFEFTVTYKADKWAES